MKTWSLILLLSFFNTNTYDKENYSLVLIAMEKEGKHILTSVPLSELKQGKIHSVDLTFTEEHELNEELIEDVKRSSDHMNVEEMQPRSGEAEVLCKIKISDLKNEYVIFALKHQNHYEAYIIANHELEQLLHTLTDQEYEDIERLLCDEKIELPSIPFPPCVTRVLVNIGMYALLSYHYVKDSFKSLSDLIYTKTADFEQKK